MQTEQSINKQQGSSKRKFDEKSFELKTLENNASTLTIKTNLHKLEPIVPKGPYVKPIEIQMVDFSIQEEERKQQKIQESLEKELDLENPEFKRTYIVFSQQTNYSNNGGDKNKEENKGEIKEDESEDREAAEIKLHTRSPKIKKSSLKKNTKTQR